MSATDELGGRERDLRSLGCLRPLLDIGPVPARSAAHGPFRSGQKATFAPDVHGVRLHAQPLSDVVGSHWVTRHGVSVPCTASLDKLYRKAVQ
jgi:hypothetical protein